MTRERNKSFLISFTDEQLSAVDELITAMNLDAKHRCGLMFYNVSNMCRAELV